MTQRDADWEIEHRKRQQRQLDRQAACKHYHFIDYLGEKRCLMCNLLLDPLPTRPNRDD